MADSSTSKSIISSSEFAFPRGGSSALTPLEVKEISNEVTRDVLFEAKKRAASETSEQPSKKHKKQSKKKSTKARETEEDEEAIVQIENVSFKNLIPGTFILGQIKNIGKLDLTLELGDNLVGYVPITSINPYITQIIEKYEESSDEEEEESEDDEDMDDVTVATTKPKKAKQEFPDLQSLFQIGSWLKTKVVNSKDSKKRRIELNIEPDEVNESMEPEDLLPGNLLQVSVTSVEDHGIILDIGKAVISGFMSNKEIKNAKLELENIHEGSVLLASIISKPSGRTITLRPANSNSNPKKATVTSISSVDAIQPGIIVDALVSDINKNGLVAKVFGLVDATINMAHLQEFNFQSLKHKYTIGNNVKARVLAVLLKSGTKKLMLSVLPNVMQLGDDTAAKEALEAFPIGHKFEEVSIVGADSNYLFVKFGSSQLFGQVHNSKIDEDKSLDDYPIGSKHKARVLGFNAIDNLLVMSLDSKVVNAEYLRSKDIPVGTLLTGCEILKVHPESGGIDIKILDEFNAFVPGNQMSDIKLVYPERKFRIGSKVKGRVIGHQGNKVLVTLRKALVNLEEDEVLSKFEDATIGFKTHATVEKFVHGGAIVSFFGNLKAYLPKNEISETFVENASDHLRLGQIVNTRIMDINEEQKRLVVTLKQSTDLSSSQKSAISDLKPGSSIVNAIIVEKTKDSVLVELEGTNLRGVIYSGQLSDANYEQNRALAKKLEIGTKLEVLILEKDFKARTVIATAKKSLIDAAKQGAIPLSFQDIRVDDKMLRGYIKSVTNFGLFVSFAGKLTGLVLAKYATENPNEDLSKKFYKHQSVACRVIRIDEENKRFLLSLTGSDNAEAEELVNPVDKTKKMISDYVPGIITKATIKAIKGTQLNVQLADNLQGRIDVTQCFNSWEEIKDHHQPLSQFTKGDTLSVKVIGFHDAKNHKFLPITHRKSNKNTILELSILEKELKSDQPFNDLKMSEIKTGDKFMAFVNNISKGFVWVSITPSIKGHVSFMELTDDVSIFNDIENKLPVGTALQVKVKENDNEHHTLILTATSKSINSIQDIKIGEKYPGRVVKVKESFVLVELGKNVVASSFITDALNDYSEKLDHVFQVNSYVVATVLDIDLEENKIAVSLRNENAVDKLINSVEDLSRGDIVKGFIKNIANNGVYVALGRSIHALVRISDLSDSYLKDWKKYFKPHQLVTGKISACKEEGRVLMTLKESEVNGDLNVLKRFDDLEVGQIFEGSVKRATEFGVFVQLDGTLNISGLCHRSEIAENKVENASSLFGEGDRVKVRILKIDPAKQQLSLGMKASYFGVEAEDEEDEDVEMKESDDEAEVDEEDAEESEDEEDIDMDSAEEGESEEESEDEDEEDEDEDEQDKPESAFTGLSTNGFDWTASILDQAEDNESSSDEEDFTQEKKRKKKSKHAVEDKTGDLNTRAPQSVADFERLLIGNPNSSIMWMNYMSFQLQLSEVEKAREIGERALKTINYREEQEKMNIWIALLNLENTFGSDESLEATFKRSCQYMDSFIMHQKLVSIYTMSEKFDQAEELYKSMGKKFGKHVSTWVQYGSFLLDREMHEETHKVLVKALQILPKREHIEVVRKFAQLEFTKGDAEQGRSLFEGLVSDAPKRIDLWNVYIDQEIKQDEKKKVEDLFERVLSKKLSRKQAKFFFKKWLLFEEEKGDEQMSARVKSKAAEYVQNSSKED
ncbi:RRP5 [[Candida] subhashii]|uniref:rRNA biogenesis protein RRP5 n=1 Tax=[Candida] subhashii TaxID=561895 RepID=A0A8J5QWD3_9ASCO|nr:RRP5 [[Candida] subhashii]KAG7665962.1 RRP5 [[Candida] subhashii]